MSKQRIIKRIVHYVGDYSNDIKDSVINVEIKIKPENELDESFWLDYETWLDEHLVNSFAFDSYAESYTLEEWKNINKELGD